MKYNIDNSTMYSFEEKQLNAIIRRNKRRIKNEVCKTGASVVACAAGLTGLIILGKMCLGHISSGEELTFANLFLTRLEGSGAVISGLVSGAGAYFTIDGIKEAKSEIRYLKSNEKRLEEIEGKTKVLKK